MMRYSVDEALVDVGPIHDEDDGGQTNAERLRVLPHDGTTNDAIREIVALERAARLAYHLNAQPAARALEARANVVQREMNIR